VGSNRLIKGCDGLRLLCNAHFYRARAAKRTIQMRGRRARTTCGGGDGDGGAGCVALRRGMSCAKRVRQKSAKSAHAVQDL
jgi:hypothetical protein